MTKQILMIGLIVMSLVSGCKKAEEIATKIQDKLIKAYWGNVDGLIMQVNDNDAVVLDFGQSKLGSNKSVFDGKTKPIIRNIVRTGPTTWSAEVVKGSYDNLNNLVSVSYVPTTITASKSSASGNEIITLTNTESSLKEWGMATNYTPPTTCDTTSLETIQGNIVSFNTNGYITSYQDVPTRSHYYKPFYGNPYTPCHYQIRGFVTTPNTTVMELYIMLPNKPTTGGTYTMSSGPWSYGLPLDEGEAHVGIDGVFYPLNSTDNITIQVSGSQVTATITDLPLTSTGHGDKIISCTLVGK